MTTYTTGGEINIGAPKMRKKSYGAIKLFTFLLLARKSVTLVGSARSWGSKTKIEAKRLRRSKIEKTIFGAQIILSPTSEFRASVHKASFNQRNAFHTSCS